PTRTARGSPARWPSGSSARSPEAAMAAAALRQGDETLGAATRRLVAGFARTLRDNGFKVGLAETRDALSVLTSPAAARPSSLKPALRALFCATRSDWERFDEIFDAYWRGSGMRRARVLSGAPTDSRATARRLAEADLAQAPTGMADHLERRDGREGDDGGA